MDESKGIIFALLAALVSGTAIFVNKFAVQGFNPFVFTFLKNIIVAVLLLAVIIALKEFSSLKHVNRKQWLKLSFIGLIGGSIPFLLYFYALKLTTAFNAGFIHKTLFLFASVGAFFFLKEKLNKNFFIGALLLLAGIFFLFGISIEQFVFADLLVLIATFFWAGESIYSKHVLKELPPKIVGFGRMFFGSVFILAFLFSFNQLPALAQVSAAGLPWIALVSAFLFFYVFFWYNALKHARVSVATSILLLGLPVTSMLSAVFLGTTIAFNQALGFFLIVAGIITVTGIGFALNFFKARGFALARTKN